MRRAAALTIGLGLVLTPASALPALSAEDVYVIALDGSGRRNLTAHPAHDELPALSPDGRRIAFIRFVGVPESPGYNGDLFVMNADGSEPRRLTATAVSEHDPAWSPDGRRIVFGVQQRALEVMSSTGGNRRPLAEGKDASWAPDGKRVVYAGKLAPDNEASVLYVTSIGGKPLKLAGGIVSNPVWSPNGRWIAYAVEGVNGAELWVTKPDGKAKRKLALGADHAWAPGSGRIVFGARGDLWTVALAGRSQPVRMTRDPKRPEEAPTWSPDGKRIAFVRGGVIHVMNANRPKASPLMSEDGPVAGSTPVWARNSLRIFYAAPPLPVEPAYSSSSTSSAPPATRSPSATWTARTTAS